MDKQVRLPPKTSREQELILFKAVHQNDIETIQNIILKGINLYYNNGHLLIKTVSEGYTTILDMINPNRLTLFLCNKKLATKLVEASTNDSWKVYDRDPDTYPALEMILLKDIRSVRENSITYKNILIDAVSKDRRSLINTLVTNISFKWELYKEIIETVIVPKINNIAKKSRIVKNNVRDVNDNIYFLIALMKENIPELESYLKETMLNAKNGLVYIVPLLVMNVSDNDTNAGLNLLESFHEIIYEDYVSEYLKNKIT